MNDTLVLALGNDILGDDAVGLAAADRLKAGAPEDVDFVRTAESGLRLLELLEGRKKALLLDSIVTGKNPPGTILRYSPEDFHRAAAPSPHYAGVPEMLQLARALGLSFPEELVILAMEIEPAREFKESLSPAVLKALPAFVEEARGILTSWRTTCMSIR